MGGHLQSQKIFFDNYIFENQNFWMGIFLKVALSSNASDYQQKLYGTRREAEKTKKVNL